MKSGMIVDRREPGLDDLLAVVLVLNVDLDLGGSSTNGPFRGYVAWFTPRLPSASASCRCAQPLDNEFVAGFVAIPGAALGLAPRANRVTTTEVYLTTTVRVVDRVRRTPRTDGRLRFHRMRQALPQ